MKRLINAAASSKELKVDKEKEPIEYALYGCPDIYGRGETQWHWSRRDDSYETDKEFKDSVKYRAARAAQREFDSYDPKSIKISYYRSEDAFLKACDKVGIIPNL